MRRGQVERVLSEQKRDIETDAMSAALERGIDALPRPAAALREFFAAVEARSINEGEVIVIRYEGPKGGPGMREMLSPTSAVMGKGLGKEVALITDGRFSGGSHGFVVGHITPEAFDGGPIALLENGDKITIDAETREISMAVSEAVMAERKAKWVQPKPNYTRGVLAKYAKLVSSASEGAVTDK